MIYVLSVIHGNKDNFDSILEKINLQTEDSLHILGDVIDRHPYGIQLLQQIMGMPNTRMLSGNYEWMMMKRLGMLRDYGTVRNRDKCFRLGHAIFC